MLANPRFLPAALALLALACGPVDEGITPLPAPPRLAVLCSDYASSAVAMLGDDDVVLDDAFITSGTVAPGLSVAISGDVVFPSTSVGSDTLLLIDRLGTDIVTDIALPSGEVRTQSPVASRGASFRGNPHDVFVVEERRWVTRFQPNLSTAPNPLDRGGDIVAIENGRVTESIALNADSTAADGEVLYARPSRAVVAGDRVVVGLARLSVGFMQTGAGAVAIIDVARGEAETLLLPSVSGCSRVAQGTGERVLVLCEGPAFGEVDARREAAAVVEITRDGETFVETRRVTAVTSRPFSNGMIVIDDETVWAVAAGELDGPPDVLVEIDLASGATRDIHRATDAFVLGDGTRYEDRVYVPDAATGVLVFALDGSLLSTIDVAASHGLGPRQILAL